MANSGNIALGGLDASQLGTVATTTAGTQLTGLKAGSTWTVSGAGNTLAVSADNLSGAPFTGTGSLIQFDGASGSIAFAEGSTLTLDLTSVADAMKTAGGTLEILLTNGTITAELAALKTHITSNPLFSALGFGIVDADGGNIVISGDTDLIYVASVDGTGSADAPVKNQELNFYQAVIVNEDLYVESDGTMVIKNLTAPGSGAGQQGTGNLIVTNTADNKGSIELQNNLFDGPTGVDTGFAGDITGLNGAAANTDLVKTGANKLTLTGTVSLAGDIIAQQGVLQLDGTADVETLRLDSSDAGAPASIGIGGNTTAQTLAAGTYGGTLDIGTSGTLTLTGATAALGNTAITGSGTLKLAQGSSLELAASSSMDGVLLELDGQLTANSDGNVSGLTGAGALTLNGHNFTVNAAQGAAHVYEGSLGEGTLTVTGGGSQTLRASGVDTDLNIDGGNLVLQGKADTDGAALTYAALENRGHLTIQASDNAISAFNTTLEGGRGHLWQQLHHHLHAQLRREPDGKLHPILRQHRGGKWSLLPRHHAAGNQHHLEPGQPDGTLADGTHRNGRHHAGGQHAHGRGPLPHLLQKRAPGA